MNRPQEVPETLEDRDGIFLALGGGGARGLAHLGMLRVLERHQIPIAGIAGTSMGALVGACFSLTPKVDSIIADFLEHIGSDVFNRERYQFFRKALVENSEESLVADVMGRVFRRTLLYGQAITKHSLIPYKAYCDEVFSLLPDRDFRQVKMPFFAIACDLNSVREVVFYKGMLRSAVMASAAIPGVFPAIRSRGCFYVDGCWVNKTPITPLKALGARKVLGINVSDQPMPEMNQKRGLSVLRAANAAAIVRLQELQVRQADLMWEPNLKALNLMDFPEVEKAVEMGEKFGEKHIDSVKRLVDEPLKSRWQIWKDQGKQRLLHWLQPQQGIPALQPTFEWRGIWDIDDSEIEADPKAIT
jgi:NTE family protein